MDDKTKEIVKAYDSAHQLKRMADAMEEILRLVKADQEKYTAREAREELQKDENR